MMIMIIIYDYDYDKSAAKGDDDDKVFSECKKFPVQSGASFNQ